MDIYIGMQQVESNCLNRLLNEVLGCAPAIILTIFFCNIKNLPTVGRVTAKNYSIIYNGMKENVVN